MRNYSIFIVTVVTMFLATACYVVPGTGDGIDDGFDYEPIIDDEVTDEVTDDVQKDDEVTDEVIDEVQMDEEVDEIADEDSMEVDETPDNDFDNDYPVASLTGPVGINEGNTDSVCVTMDRESEEDEVFYLSFNVDGTDTAVFNTDYSVSATSVIVPSGSKSVCITVSNKQNDTVDHGRTMSVRLYAGSNGINLGTSQIVIWLWDDDSLNSGVFSFSSSAMEVVEGSRVCVNIVRTGGDINLTASVVVNKISGDLSDVTMDPAGDYVNGVTFEFMSGVTTRELCLTAEEDEYLEGNEKINFVLGTPSENSTLDGTKNTFEVTIKDTASEEKEIIGDNGKELLCTFTKDYSKCRAGSTVFSVEKEYTYKILSYTFYCDGMNVGDALHCETVGYDYETDEACSLPEGGVGYTWNEDGC